MFVRLDGPLCYPVPLFIRQKLNLSDWLKHLQETWELSKKMRPVYGYSASRSVLSGRFYHRSRIKGFPVYLPDELLALGTAEPTDSA